MAESLPVVTVPGDEELGAEGIDISPVDIVVLHEVVVEELPIVEGLDGEETVAFAVVTEPSEPSDGVIVIGSSGEEEEEEEEEVVELVERVADGPPRGGMATDAGIHPVSVPTEMPIEDVPPDETMTALPVEDDVEVVERVADGPPRGGMATDAGIHPVSVPTEMPIEGVPPDETMTALPVDEDITGEVVKGENDEVRVVSEVTERKVTVVEEVVTVVEEVVVATGEVVGKTVTDTVKIDETLTVNETVSAVDAMETDGEKGEKKRIRDAAEEEDTAVKKLKSDAGQSEKEEEKVVVEPKKLGPKLFTTPVEMFSYFYNLLHDWNLNQNVNKYEFLVLSELVSQGNPQKVGEGISAFQVRMHPKWQSRCYYLIRKDGSEDDFSYRKCCDALMPLPASLYRKNGELDLEKLFPGQKGRHHREQQQNGGGGRGRGDRGDHRGGRGGGGGRFGGRGGGNRGGRGGGGGRRGGRGRW